MEYFLLVASAVVAVVPLMVRWPVETALGVYALLLPFDSVLLAGQVGTIHLHLTWFAGIVACCVLLLTGLANRGFRRPPGTALWLSLFVLWVILSPAWALNTQTATFRWPILVLLLILYLVAVSMPLSEKEVRRVASLAILGGLLAASVSLYQFSQGQYWIPQDLDQAVSAEFTGSRATLTLLGQVTDPNILAASLIMPLALAFGLWFSSHNWIARILSLGAGAFLGACIFLTFSRGALFAVSIVFLVYLWRSRANWRALLPIALTGVVAAAMVAADPRAFSNRLDETLYDRGAGRLDIWSAALLAFQDHAVLGVGVDGFPEAVDRYRYVYTRTFPGSKAPHNIYLGTAVELGAAGLALLLCIITSHLLAFARVFRRQTDQAARFLMIPYEASCWGLFACGFFLDVLWESYFWLALMLVIMAVQARQTSQAGSALPMPELTWRLAGERTFARTGV